MLVEMFLTGQLWRKPSIIQKFIIRIKFLSEICSFVPKKYQLSAFTDPYRSNPHPSLCNVLYRTYALIVLGVSLPKQSLYHLGESAVGEGSLWPSRPLTSLWML